jgi:hypothetical protein
MWSHAAWRSVSFMRSTPSLSSARPRGREDSVITRPSEGIVARNVDQGGEKCVAHRARCAGEPAERVVAGRARDELAVADG